MRDIFKSFHNRLAFYLINFLYKVLCLIITRIGLLDFFTWTFYDSQLCPFNVKPLVRFNKLSDYTVEPRNDKETTKYIRILKSFLSKA